MSLLQHIFSSLFFTLIRSYSLAVGGCRTVYPVWHTHGSFCLAFGSDTFSPRLTRKHQSLPSVTWIENRHLIELALSGVLHSLRTYGSG